MSKHLPQPLCHCSLRADGDRHLILDLSGCEFCDSAGLSAMARLMREAQDQGCRMVLAGSRPSVARTLELTGLSEVIPSYSTVPDALAALPAATT